MPTTTFYSVLSIFVKGGKGGREGGEGGYSSNTLRGSRGYTVALREDFSGA